MIGIRTDDPIADAERYYASLEEKAKDLPLCSQCGERIYEDYAYMIEGDYVCEDCIDKFRISINN
jgi:hypothetical protein